MCSLRFENNLFTIEGVRFASISKKTPLSKLSFAFVSLSLPLLGSFIFASKTSMLVWCSLKPAENELKTTHIMSDKNLIMKTSFHQFNNTRHIIISLLKHWLDTVTKNTFLCFKLGVNSLQLPPNAHILTPFFQKTVFFSKIFFGKPPSKFLEVCLNSEYM
jgi:hypothetical protein